MVLLLATLFSAAHYGNAYLFDAMGFGMLFLAIAGVGGLVMASKTGKLPGYRPSHPSLA